MILEKAIINIIKAILCHLIGDYVLQSDFIARTKFGNSYHLFVHCALYVVPFWIAFGYDWIGLSFIFLSHLIIDFSKVKGLISYTSDQVYHYICILGYLCIIDWRL